MEQPSPPEAHRQERVGQHSLGQLAFAVLAFAVALMWLVPDRRIKRVLATHKD